MVSDVSSWYCAEKLGAYLFAMDSKPGSMSNVDFYFDGEMTVSG